MTHALARWVGSASATILIALAIGGAPHARAAHHVPGCRPGGSQHGVSWARHRHMMALVDSVLLGGAPALQAAMPCWHITVRGRPALMIRVADQELRAQHPHVPPLVVVALGYNSLWEHNKVRYGYWAHRFDDEATALLATLRKLGARQIVWVTLRQPTAADIPPGHLAELNQYAWYFPYVNARLRRLDRLRSDLVLADWEAVSKRPGVTYDTIHLNPTGATLMATTIKHAITHEAARQAP